MFYMFTIIPNYIVTMSYLYAAMLILSIFSFTSILDRSKYALVAESIKLCLGFSLLYNQNYSWFGLSGFYVYGLIFYFITSFILTYYFHQNGKKISSLRPDPVQVN